MNAGEPTFDPVCRKSAGDGGCLRLPGLARVPTLFMMTETAKKSARWTLRDETAADHRRIDKAYSVFDLGDREEYRGFLQAQADAVLSIEKALDEAGAQGVLPDWPARSRSAALRADIAALDGDEAAGAAFPGFSSTAQILGAIYVLEGSRLGGRLLARAIHPEFPRAFFAEADPRAWMALMEILDKALISDDEITAAVGAARSVFARFEAGARLYARTR